MTYITNEVLNNTPNDYNIFILIKKNMIQGEMRINNLSSKNRYLIHKICADFGLEHLSTGNYSERVIIIKDNSHSYFSEYNKQFENELPVIYNTKQQSNKYDEEIKNNIEKKLEDIDEELEYEKNEELEYEKNEELEYEKNEELEYEKNEELEYEKNEELEYEKNEEDEEEDEEDKEEDEEDEEEEDEEENNTNTYSSSSSSKCSSSSNSQITYYKVLQEFSIIRTLTGLNLFLNIVILYNL